MTLRIYDANGDRVGYIRRPAASGKQNFRKLSSAEQPLTVLLTIDEGNDLPKMHARTSVRLRA